ncbi:MAG TPA: hypothetical protein VHE37_02860 [Nevskiaceae bacterium]|nr:hypothetical protein [Nevskiaceae bacterium]
MRMRRLLCAAGALAIPVSAYAHGFGRLYNLPVPFWLYAWAAGAALVLSFLLIAWFATAPPAPASSAARDISNTWCVRALRWVRPLLRTLAVSALLLCMATGWWGSVDPYRNFSMTSFWIVFVLGCTYLTALSGNFYAALNPWKTLADGIARRWARYAQGRVRYAESLGDWPALALYLGFVWFELFNHGYPSTLAWMLFAYSLLNLAGVWWVGAPAWFAHCEFFSVFLRLVGVMAPLDYQPGYQPGAPHGTLRWRLPLSGVMHERPAHLSTVIFALAMLSTTAFDGLRATQWWVGLVWRDPTGWLTALLGTKPIMVYPMLRPWYIAWESFWLLASPFIYAAAYCTALLAGKLLTRSARPLRELLLDFGYTLLPIALVYNLAHYSTLVLGQGMKIISLLSDPFGRGWNLFGTAHLLRAPILPGMGIVWHSQVLLILLGHVLGVYAAHRVALRVWPSRGAALASQLPMLLLMLALTVSGLWILAQPLTDLLMR